MKASLSPSFRHAASATFAAFFLAWCLPAHAFDDQGMGVYVEGGRAPHGEVGSTNTSTIGMMLPWTPFPAMQSGAVSSYVDLFASQWRAPPVDQGHRSYAQLGAIAVLRYRFDQGASPWFVEGGLGVSVLDHLYRTPEREFSTAFQFTEVLAVGRSFGRSGNHELSLRAQHFSNGSIKKPNPGENFVRVRYAYRF